jgi:UDP-N-acetylmuramate dehydrogenase
VSDFDTALRQAFGARVGRDVPLAPLTSFQVGGPADWLVEPRTSDEIVAALQLAHRFRVAVTVLGGGSNVLVADHGVRGLVLRPRGGAISQVDERHIRADAAATINGLVRWTISHGVAGLEAWAGTPGTVGGAIVGNAHFSGRLIGDRVTEVRVAARDGRIAELQQSEMSFGYDRSRLQETGEVLLSAVFRVTRGDVAQLRETARASLAFRKGTQPLAAHSAGCVFQNPQRGRDAVPDGIPWSAGALVDRAGLKGASVGGAHVSHVHGNFIVNDGSATARDVRILIEQCRNQVRQQFDVELREEIVYLGQFDDNEENGEGRAADHS